MSLASDLLQKLNFTGITIAIRMNENGKLTTDATINYENFYELVDAAIEKSAEVADKYASESGYAFQLASEIRELKHVQPPAPNVEKVVIKPIRKRAQKVKA